MDEKTGIIYRAYLTTRPEDTLYVGATTVGVEKRRLQHLRGHNKTAFSDFLQTQDPDTVVFEGVEEAPAPELSDLEIKWIAHYKSLGQARYNVHTGGGGFHGGPINPRKGEELPWSKLSMEKAREIRGIRLREWVSESDLADRYGVTQSVIHRVLRNKIWVDPEFDPDTITTKRPPESHANNRQIDREVVDEIRALRMREWVSEPEIARRYGLTRSNVHNILSNVRWVDPEFDPAAVVQAGGNGLGSKLTVETVEAIRSYKGAGIAQREVAKLFGISQTQVSRIWRGVQWSGVKKGSGK